MKALRIPVSGPTELVDVDVTLKWLQEQVGGFIEHVYVYEVLTDQGRRHVDACVWLNEEGKLNSLPVNPRATDFCALTIGGWFRDVIVGDVVIVGPPGPDGNETPVQDAVVRIVRDWGWFAAETAR